MPHVVEYFGQSLQAALSRINMVTFANLGSVRLPYLLTYLPSSKFVGLRVRKIRRIQCVNCLSTTVSQLFEPQLKKKLSFLRTPAFIFCLPWGRPCGNHAKRCMNEKTIQCLPNPSQHVRTHLSSTVSQLFELQVQKNRRFHVPQPTFFVSPGDAPATITQCIAWMERQFNACQTPRSMYPSIFNSLPVIRTASAKNRRFHVPQPTFLFPLGTPLGQSR